jgi:hypothetical protein
MMRTAIGLSFLVALAVGGVGACSSEPTKSDNAGGQGSGGSSNNGGAQATSGNGGRAGSTGTSGAGSGLCADKPNVCLDMQTVQVCDPLNGMDVVVDCEEDVEPGLVNLGCDTASDGVTKACLLDFADEECLEGADILAFCAGATEEQFFNAYFNCFNDAMGAHEIVTCFIPFADEATFTVDCEGAAEACIPDMGAGGAGPGAGGEGPGAGGEAPGAGGAD